MRTNQRSSLIRGSKTEETDHTLSGFMGEGSSSSTVEAGGDGEKGEGGKAQGGP